MNANEHEWNGKTQIRVALFALMATILTCCSAATGTEGFYKGPDRVTTRLDDLEVGFRNPTGSVGVRCFWWWLNSNVTKEAITRDLEEMKDKGFSGTMIFDADGSSHQGNRRVPAGPVFGGPEWTKLFVHACKETKRLDLQLSLNIQSGWGSHVILATATPDSWFFEGLGGILPDRKQPGFKHFTLRPGVVKSVDWVKCSYESTYGKIVSNWKLENGSFAWDIKVPVNTTATIYVPARRSEDVTENGNNILKTSSVKFLRMDKNRAVFKVESGNYKFISKQ